MNAQLAFAFGNELIVDLFAGGGGASWAIEQAFGRKVDIAVNHDPVAVGMHEANHPTAKHFCEDVFAVDPRSATGGRPVGLLHASPDCTHFSQAGGGQPRSSAIRSLSWVVLKWAGQVRPRVITLENVKQILTWSPLRAKRDRRTRRVMLVDRTLAAPGERVPLDRQFLVPCTRRRGSNWDVFVARLRAMGYQVQWKNLRASDYGAGTTRDRLYMVARCDGQPIVWPKPTHGKGRGLLPLVTAAANIDWSIPCPSIFDRKKALADNSLRRIAKGTVKFVLNAAEPFIVPVTHPTDQRVHAADEPLRTITSASRGEFAAVAPVLVPRYGERPTQDPRALRADEPAPTVVPTGNGASLAACMLAKFRYDSAGSPADAPCPTITGGGAMKRDAGAAHSLATVMAYIEQANGGPNGHPAADRDAREPLSSITTKGCQQRLVAAHLQHASTSNTNGGRGHVTRPLRTVMAGGQHHAVVEATLSPEVEAGALRVAAFLIRYYGEGGQWGGLNKPAHTLTTKERIALVTVTVRGEPYVIVDIGLRMLTPPELFACQGFPRDYIIDRMANGKRLTKTQQVRLVGNSVSPPPYTAIVTANCGRMIRHEREAAAA